MSIITTSVFDLFKIGPGPSSSHTIGPMRIGRHYLALLRDMSADKRRLIDRIEIRLFGSLTATGQGHGTDRAVIAGLLDWTPEETDPDEFTTLLDNDAEYMLPLDGSTIMVSASSIIYDEIVHDHEFSN